MKLLFYDILLILGLSLYPVLSNAQTSKELTVNDLRCCNLHNPEGVDAPLLSWKIRSLKEDVSQTAWEVELATAKDLLVKGKANVWKSGKRLSAEQFNIIPEAKFPDATSYFWHVRVWNNKGGVSAWSNPAYFSVGLRTEKSWQAKWITYNETKNTALPYFRKIFNVSEKNNFPVKAWAYFCGLGCGELYMNGQRVDSTRFFDPAQTNYEQYALYSTFDITHFLKKGNNCIGVMLGNGWFSQNAGWGGIPFGYGSPRLKLQLVILYKDGSRRVWGTDESWQWKEGPVIKANVYLGESYDARREVEGWCNADNLCPDWSKAIVVNDGVPPRLVPSLIDPIRTQNQILKAVKMWRDSAGNWIYDFGVNVTGVPCINVTQPAGTHLSVRVAEEKKTNGSLDFTSTGWGCHGKVFTDEYVCNGKDEKQWFPHYTYHGFRYAELSGMVGQPNLTTLQLVRVHTDFERRGTFECSNLQINRLHELALRTVLNNMQGVPTDCPDREKCGWLGDTHAYMKMANLNLQMNNFWVNYLEDIRSGANKAEKNTLFHERYNTTFYGADKPVGLPYMIAPGKRLCGVASPDWGTAVVQLPWGVYMYYGNKTVLRGFYPDMKQWTDYVSTLAKDTARTNKYSKKTKYIVYQGLGDWCLPDGKLDTPVEFTSTAFHYNDVCIMEQAAHVLGKVDDEKKYAQEKRLIAGEVEKVLYNVQKKTYGSQTADAMALDFGLVPAGDEKAVADAIARNMNEKYGGFMHCGIFGLSRIGSMLARNGNSQSAWNMFTKEGENSFEWMWRKADATTLWETLPVHETGRNLAGPASHDHPMQAGYDVCFYEDIAGIRPDASGYGFKVVRFEPLFTDYLSWAKASVESPYGTIVSNWEKNGGKLKWQIVIPANSSGLVALPAGYAVLVNGIKLNTKKYVPVGNEGETILYHFPSGNFLIQL